MQYLEDLVVGVKERFGHYEVTREEVIAFAEKYDPQPFHLSDEAAAKTHFGRLAASGWHTCAMSMAMVVENMKGDAGAGLGSPGVDELRWLKPVHPGDTLSMESEILEVRPSRSRPDMGSFKIRSTVFNQHDDPVLAYVATILMRRRPAEM